jgi:hypothetical protein
MANKTEFKDLLLSDLIDYTEYFRTYTAYDNKKKMYCYVEISQIDNSYNITY